MLSRIYHLLRTTPPRPLPLPLPSSSMAARVLTRVLHSSIFATSSHPRSHVVNSASLRSSVIFGWAKLNSRSLSITGGSGNANGIARMGIMAVSRREYRKVRSRRPPAARKVNEKELKLSVSIVIEEQLPEDPEILGIAELLRLNIPMAMKLAFDGLTNSTYKTRDTSISEVGSFETVELSIVLCNDEFIRKLNKEWRNEDHATDVLSVSSHIPEIKLPILMLGDIVISVETAARQAKESGHTLLDEIRILAVHGLLHLLGFDHELGIEAEEEMEKEEELLLKGLGWKGKGLIQCAQYAETDESAQDADTNGSPHIHYADDRKREGSLRFYKPKFSYIFCDMDGTLLNSRNQISLPTVNALKEATSRGVKVVIATGKTRPAVINILKMVDLAYKDGISSEFSPGVFVQGLLVYGRQGQEIFRRNLDPNVCREALLYSLKHEIPLIAFSEDRCLTLFEHPLVDCLHTMYHEPKAEIIPSVEQLLAGVDIQKLVFLDTAERVCNTLRPYWAEVTGDRASVVQAVPDMLEIVPPGTSKGSGLKLLLDHLGVTPKEVMAIGDGENDVEMLALASLGVALSNGSQKAKAVANVIGISNDEDGVADAIYRYAF